MITASSSIIALPCYSQLRQGASVQALDGDLAIARNLTHDDLNTLQALETPALKTAFEFVKMQTLKTIDSIEESVAFKSAPRATRPSVLTHAQALKTKLQGLSREEFLALRTSPTRALTFKETVAKLDHILRYYTLNTLEPSERAKQQRALELLETAVHAGHSPVEDTGIVFNRKTKIVLGKVKLSTYTRNPSELPIEKRSQWDKTQQWVSQLVAYGHGSGETLQTQLTQIVASLRAFNLQTEVLKVITVFRDAGSCYDQALPKSGELPVRDLPVLNTLGSPKQQRLASLRLNIPNG
jgi:hypothetical protein